MSVLYQLSDGSEGAKPDGSGSQQNGSINLSDSEAERSVQLLSTFPGFPESKGQTIYLAGVVFTPNVAAQLSVPPAINFGGAETTSLLHPRNSPMSSLSPVSAFNGLGGPTRPDVAEPNVVEPIEEESFLEEYDEEDDDGLEIELHESQVKVAEQSAALQVQQAHLLQQGTAMLEMQKMMATMGAQMAMMAKPSQVISPQAPSAIVAPTPPLSTRTPLTFPGYGVPLVLPVVRTSN